MATSFNQEQNISSSNDRSKCGAIIGIGGVSGCGSSTVARALSQASGIAWYDLDTEAARALATKSAAEAIRQYGELAFRNAEYNALKNIVDHQPRDIPCVVALGGGAVLHAPTAELIAGALVTIQLTVDADTAWQRIAADTHTERPYAADATMHSENHAVRNREWTAHAEWSCNANGSVAEVTASVHAIAREHGVMARAHGLAASIDDLPRLACVYGRRVAIVTDIGLPHEHVQRVLAALTAAQTTVLTHTEMAAGEWAKDLAVTEYIWHEWTRAQLLRGDLVVAVGGGTVTDTVGYCAAQWRRGVDWLSVPTTLLAQADAGIGGKTGINFGARKNRLGSIHMPVSAIIDNDVLETLPQREVRAGCAEVIKTALVVGGDLWQRARVAQSSRDVAALARACAREKLRIVDQDPFDSRDIRAALNFGHTVAHALEHINRVDDHGEAVAIGMRVALELSREHVVLDAGIVDDATALMSRCALPDIQPCAASDVMAHLADDAKSDAAGPRFVLLEDVGRIRAGQRVAQAEFAAAWHAALSSEVDTTEARDGSASVMALFGVNLIDIGDRAPQHYGGESFRAIAQRIRAAAANHNVIVDIRWSDSLERLIAAIRDARDAHDAIIINPGAFTHSEPALHDALEAYPGTVVELHFSDPAAREEWRRTSVLADVRDALIAGHGPAGIELAFEALKRAESVAGSARLGEL